MAIFDVFVALYKLHMYITYKDIYSNQVIDAYIESKESKVPLFFIEHAFITTTFQLMPVEIYWFSL